MTEPYYRDEAVTLYCGDCKPLIWDGDVITRARVLVTDPPFGISYESNKDRLPGNARSIRGDSGTVQRDFVLDYWDNDRPALVFGSWKVPRPWWTRMVLIWDAGPAVGMGDLSLPWKPCWQEIYVMGDGFEGKRTSGVLRYPPVQTTARAHPHEKPVDLMCDLIGKCPPGTVLDPFCGAGSTLIAAKKLGRKAIGIEIDERYCEVAAERLTQGVLDLQESA